MPPPEPTAEHPDGPAPSIHVAIATYDRRDLLTRTLESLARARRPEGFEKVWVLENGGGDAGRAVCERLAEALPLAYHQLPAPGKSRALQLAMEWLKSGFAIFLDDDVRVGEGLLEAYAAAIRVHGRGRFYGGPLHVDFETEPPAWLERFLPRSARGWTPPNPDKPFVGRERFMGANYGAFVEDVLAVGGFREDLGPGAQRPGTEGNPSGQERELQDRLLLAHVPPTYVADAHVWHWVPRDRCTVDWALHRVYRHRYSRTLLRELENPPHAPRFRDVPLRSWSRLVRAGARAGFARLASSPEARFRASHKLHKVRGEIEGHRVGARSRGDDRISERAT